MQSPLPTVQKYVFWRTRSLLQLCTCIVSRNFMQQQQCTGYVFHRTLVLRIKCARMIIIEIHCMCTSILQIINVVQLNNYVIVTTS